MGAKWGEALLKRKALPRHSGGRGRRQLQLLEKESSVVGPLGAQLISPSEPSGVAVARVTGRICAARCLL